MQSPVPKPPHLSDWLVYVNASVFSACFQRESDPLLGPFLWQKGALETAYPGG